jgi:hypothetical protein
LKHMSVAPQEDSLKEETEGLIAHMSTLQSQLREIDLMLRKGGEGGDPRAGDAPTAIESPLRNVRPTILAKAKALLELMVKSEAPGEAIYLMRAAETAMVVDARDNIAKLIGGPAMALTKTVAQMPAINAFLLFLWTVGIIIGVLSFIKVIPVLGTIISPCCTTPIILYGTLRMSR